MYSTANQQRLRLGYLTVSQTYYRLMTTCLSFPTESQKSLEYIRHGFLRRLGILQRCIQNIYRVYPIERTDIPSRDEILDLTVNLQSFIFNIFGCIDNLAWIWVAEKQLTDKKGRPLRRMDVSFRSEIVIDTLPRDFRDYLENLIDWFEYMEEFRHALAHRIPLYIPPYTVRREDEAEHNDLEERKGDAIRRGNFAEYDRLDTEQMRFARFTPAMTHSHVESSGSVAFHSQVLADWNTVAEIADKFFEAIKSIPS